MFPDILWYKLRFFSHANKNYIRINITEHFNNFCILLDEKTLEPLDEACALN